MVTKANVEAWALQVEKGSKAEKFLKKAIHTFKSHEDSFQYSVAARNPAQRRQVA